MLRSIIRSHFQWYSSMFPLTNSEIAWNLKCNNVTNSCLLVNKRTLLSTEVKKNICKTFYRLKMKRIPKEISEPTHLLRCTKCMSQVGTGTSPCIFHFFQPPYLHQMVCFLNSWNEIVKPLCGKMLDWFNFRSGEIVDLIHALEEIY